MFVQSVAKKFPPLSFLKHRVPARSHILNRNEDNVKHSEQFNIVKSTKVICFLYLLLQLFNEKCRHPTCNLTASTEFTLIGTSVLIKWSCMEGHCGNSYSSYDCNGVLATNLQSASAILYSGNNFSKLEKFSQFLGLSFLSKSTFFRYQRLYCVPVVNEWWNWQQETIMNDLKGKELVVNGDGQCDSPGHSAKNLCYYMMEMNTSFIIDLEILDKRHTDLKSANVEREALRIILQRLTTTLDIVEVVTDASSSIIKMIGKS